MIGQRIKELREFKGLSRRELERLTGIPDYKWVSIETERQQTNGEHIAALAKIWPEYKHWIVFGETIPEVGQISPELEETREKLAKAGGSPNG
ncbi:helix-turn-helix domain-containing protein [Methylococcus mesophilus]|uniref:helix-turn-helix domain-containing protein n=1 Tax=Methylococcus mesophilus TaxID=2993564 RepID=UPI00224B197E|nr:helix-turn-helix transcriptional regulator [Methylococcus mesophilus]UZR30732.1 helix-turn-helix transcriptional regulator [Methylococcus mesophilus]